ncbi:MAG: hypothetical protein IRY87_31615 [Acetobacteraceae bacterium]|nr:hypothetical protein [Acetobacteraceae bacterium]
MSTVTVTQIDGQLFVNGQPLQNVDTSQPLTVESINGSTTVNGQPVTPADASVQPLATSQAVSNAGPVTVNTAGAESVSNVEAANLEALLASFNAQHPGQVIHLDISGQGEAIDWDALAAIVQANFALTGHWFI